MTLYNEGSIWCEDNYMSMILLVNEVLGTDFEPSDIYYRCRRKTPGFSRGDIRRPRRRQEDTMNIRKCDK